MKNETLKIIAGKWRGKKIQFPGTPGLRPTPSHIRETLFNWLRNDIHGATCLDVFAGSGALGFEAASRGAAQVVMLDSQAEPIQFIRKQIPNLLGRCKLSAQQVSIPEQSFHSPFGKAFDIIFLDPPYYQSLLALCYTWLIENQLVADNTLIYIEAERKLRDLELPKNWHLLKSKASGQVSYHLVRVDFSS